jgi:hypothetical protein
MARLSPDLSLSLLQSYSAAPKCANIRPAGINDFSPWAEDFLMSGQNAAPGGRTRVSL